MTAECKPFSSLDEIPFDDLIEASLPKMDGGTYDWRVVGAVTVDEKVAHIRAHVGVIMADDDAFNYLVSLDGYPILATFGRRRGDELLACLALGRPDRNGSRSYVYNQAVHEARNACLADAGIVRLVGFMPRDSTLRPSIEQRQKLGAADYEPMPGPANLDRYTHVDLDPSARKAQP